MIGFVRRFLLGAAVCLLAGAALAAPRVEHVFVISIDGGNPDVMQRSKMPVLKKLMKEGAHTTMAKTITPPITLPAHASMLTGVGTNKHKVTWNNLSSTNGLVEAPTIFSMAKQAGFLHRDVRGQGKILLSPPAGRRGRVQLPSGGRDCHRQGR